MEEKSGAKIVISIIVLVWFFASIGAMLYCSKQDMPWLVLALFGQYFIVFGAIALAAGIKGRQFQPLPLLFVLVGIGCAAAGLILQYGTDGMAKLLENLAPYLFLSIFVLVGVGMLAGGVTHYERKKNTCTYVVNARVVQLKTSRGKKGSILYSPVYEIYYGGEYKKICSNMYTNVKVPQVGDYKQLMVNPADPDEIREPGTETFLLWFFVGMGILFMACGIIGMVLYAVL